MLPSLGILPAILLQWPGWPLQLEEELPEGLERRQDGCGLCSIMDERPELWKPKSGPGYFASGDFERNENYLIRRIVHLTCVSLAVSDVDFVSERKITCSRRLSRSTLGRKRQACAGS